LPLFDLDSYSPKTSPRCLGTPTHFRSSSTTYPTSGSLSNGQLFQRAPWVPHTDDDACSSWRTPVARDFRGYTNREGESICNQLRRMYGGVGRANPRWLEWLMGFPVGWCETTSTRLETLWSPPSPNTSAESCSPPTSGTPPEQDTAMTTARPLHVVPDEPTTAAPEWDAPMPLGTSRPVPPFPVDALPGWMADHVAAVAELTQTPPDLAGCLALVALSTAAGGRVRVEIRPGWTEPVNLYSVVVLPPASRKSAVFKAMTRPIRMVEKELIDQAKVDIESARIGRRAAEEFAARAEKAALTADPSDRDAALEAAVNAAMQVDKNALPKTPRLIADDATPEVVATLLADHGGRIAVLSAEGGLFGTLAGRYSGSPNLDVFLKGHAGDLHLVDRQGREATAVEEPAITLGLTIQPSILDGLARNETFRGTGLLARIMYSLPVNTVGNRISRPAAPDPEIGDAYDLRIRSLVRELAEWTDPAVLVFTPAADDLMADLQDEIEPRLHPVTGSWAHLGDWGGKQAGLTARIAALLHLAHNPTSWAGAITTDIFTAARRITDYAAQHALAAFDRMGSDPVIDDARVVLDWIERTRPTSFTVRELFTTLSRARFRKVGDLVPVLDLLEQHGHVHLAPPPAHPGRGRKPSPTYYVHPTHRAGGQP
jgi:hypothetical protein